MTATRKFFFQFESLLQVLQNRRNLRRHLLAQVLINDRALIEQRQEIERNRAGQLDELRGFGKTGEVAVDRSASRRDFAGQLLGDIGLVECRRELVQQQLQLCRTALVKADQDVKVLEKLAEKQRSEHLYRQERCAARELEDVWSSMQLTEV